MALSDASGPLAGLRVLDLTEHMAGPFCTMILADMGADVIKVERPGKGDSSRTMGDGAERNPFFRYINRNKKSVTLDYKGAPGREVFLRLVRSVDVLVENYRATVMERAGLAYVVLDTENPRLVYAQLSGFGADGPYRDKGGFDLIAQGMGGLMHVTGEADGPPTSVGQPICDLGTGMWGVQGILAALYERARTGRGQKVDCSLLETALGFSGWTSAAWLVDGHEPRRQGARHRQNAPYQRFATQDGYLMIGAATQELWERCARALGRPEWIEDPRFRRNADRMRHRDALEKEIEHVLATRPTAHWVAALDSSGVPSGPVNTYGQLFSDPQVRHLEMVAHVDDAELGRVPHVRTPVRLSRSRVAVRTVAPKLGAHTTEVLGGVGYSAAELAALRRAGAI
jgi:crotonobetainyl-CoA:carnitine CoA-transferase CaiB-like acyl-CoA transferase